MRAAHCSLRQRSRGEWRSPAHSDDGSCTSARPPSATPVAARLAANGVNPLHQGQVVVQTWQEHEEKVHVAIRELGLDLAVATNQGALMILPAGVSKATGAAEALCELGIPLDACVGVGDGEDDLELLALCGLSVAVANALPSVKRVVSLVVDGERGAGVAELVQYLLAFASAQAAPQTWLNNR